MKIRSTLLGIAAAGLAASAFALPPTEPPPEPPSDFMTVETSRGTPPKVPSTMAAKTRGCFHGIARKRWKIACPSRNPVPGHEKTVSMTTEPEPGVSCPAGTPPPAM